MSKSEAKKRAVKQAQKPAKAPREHKPLSRRAKRILFITLGVLVAAVLTTGLILRANALRRARTTVVGFYDVDASQQQYVAELLSRTFEQLPEVQAAKAAAAAAEIASDGVSDSSANEIAADTGASGTSAGNAGTSAKDAPILEFITLTDDDAADPKLTKKIDVLITQTGALTTSLMTNAAAESAEIAARFPRTTQSSPYFSLDGQFVVMPLFLDHFESAYYTTLQKKVELSLPLYLSEYAEYAERLKEHITYPIIASGADDTVLFSMVSAVAESVTGASGYQELVARLAEIARKGASFEGVLDLPLTGDAPEGLVFGDILRVFRDWRDEGLILGNWYETAEGTIRAFMEDYQSGIIQMMLSQHRRMPSPMIKYYESMQFPTDTSRDRALIAPSVSYMYFNETIATSAFADALSTADNQEYLSIQTHLAPATLRGQSFDMQADDVRYFAATSAGGPVPELGRAAFASAERRAAFASWLREVLSY